MSNIDQFESLFRSAIRDVYEYRKLSFKHPLIVTDLQGQADMDFINQVKLFSQTTDIAGNGEWHYLNKDDFFSTSELLNAVEALKPDLIFTYRNMHSEAWKYPHSLGEHLDVLIQKTDVPVFIMPHPTAGYAHDHAMKNCDVVMALTDHLSNDHELVNHAVYFTQNKGTLYLGHIEDVDIFNRYIEAISRIQTINTDEAREEIAKELLKQPESYINSVIEHLSEKSLDMRVISEVSFGHHLTEFRKRIDDYRVDLLVMNAKDSQQMAMHGLAYPLAIELRQIPLLMI
ncbi:hypothetical protein MNBD_GAMMA09-2282 [hydrothermal vent metagenome]|uniref:UspA domain-containing protein n=1 Tax=hydrothermal vent metagenome TaxID=652676 RepID=A0A3B0XTV4_9ZZZZ